jgi:hypothetical protein
MIRDSILLQKAELEGRMARERYVERDAVLKGAGTGMISAIIGPRRAGKSFFAMHNLISAGSFGYANFDDEVLAKAGDYNEIMEAIKSVYGNPKRLLFDEIQNLGNWELFVNRLQRQGYEITITGSNSNLLSMELASHLTGRHLKTVIFPFSFREFIRLSGRQLTEAETKEKLNAYLTNGGYPEPNVKGMDFREYLSALFDSVIYKDIVMRFRIRSPQAINDLALYLASNVAKEFSYNTLARVTKSRSVHTAEKYLGYLEEAFLFFRVTRFSAKVGEQVSSNKKIYCIDNGIVTAKAFRLSPDIGRLFENAVATELKRAEAEGLAEIYYWKSLSHEEVDFVVKRGTAITHLIQVCYEVGSEKTKRREIRSLIHASKELGCRNLIVITGGYEAEEDAEWFGTRRKILFVPLWKWLLGTGEEHPVKQTSLRNR